MFLNPLMLAGLGGAMLPLVLHLLARSRFRTVDWAAMMFLQGADPRQQQSTRLKQWLLLLLRMMLVSLLAIALARPLVSDTFAAVASGGHLSAVLVVDGSLSTTAVENGKSRAELIRQAAIGVLSSLQKGDEAAVLVAGTAGRSATLTTDLARLADDIAAIKPSGRANLAESLARADELLNQPGQPNRRLFVICDRQALSWREADDAFRAAWRARAAKDSPPTPLIILPIGGTASDNLALQNLTVVNPPLVREQPMELEAKIRNFGLVRRAGVPVVLTVNGHDVGRATVDCPPDTTVPVRLTARIFETGPQVVTATIQLPSSAALPGITADDSFDLAVDITDPTRVLILSGDERSPKPASESFFATIALQPFAAAGKSGGDPCKVTVLPITSASPGDVQAAQVVILANPLPLSPALATAIEQFAYDGGGVMIAPGGLSRAADLNDRLYRDGAGCLPAKLNAATDQAEPVGLGQIDLAHPVTQFLRGRPDAPPATFSRWFKLAPLRADARVIASLSNGDPFAVECTVGKGRVMLLAIPIDADWSTLPLTSFYLPFMQSSVRWLTGFGADRNLSPGEPIVFSWTTAVEMRSASVTTPDGRVIPVEPLRQGERGEIRFAGTDQPGTYRVHLFIQHGKDLNVPFVVTRPSEESDLTAMRRDDWRKLETELNATVIEPDGRPIADLLTASRTGKEIWGLLVLGVIGCALIETWLAGRWSSEEG
ncbi:hypothetical protein BH10PLA1_BH10PLA1_17230 [soil metagenome]